MQTFESEYKNIKYNEKIPGRKNNFGVFVSCNDIDTDVIDNNSMFSINEHSPQSVAVSILNLAGFSVSASAISNDPAFWFYEVLISMFEETPASKKKLSIKPLTLKSIELGTNGGQRSKGLIKNLSSLLKLFPSKENKSQEEINIAALNELFIKKRNCLPKREDLVFITKKN